ncbi:MAG TPA: ABC transporter ATP-binding protein [Xanthomonadaceae bacterium]|nr:ABC transporter ATP-binding protein [Xanthomonadaceae bacterium]
MDARIAIRLRNVVLSFPMGRRLSANQFEALHDVSLELLHGEKLGVVGRNGAGKSTLLRVLAGVLTPDAGHVERRHGAVQLLALGLGFMNHLTGRENAVLSGMLLGMRKREIVSKLAEIRAFAELGEFFDQPLSTYSSGMRSRLGFAVALQRNPDLLLIDEVLAVGDSTFREKSRQALRERLGSDATVVLVAHDERLISEICTRVLWLEKGRTVMQGPPEDVLTAYARSAAADAQARVGTG